MLSKIVSIPGQSGLFKVVSQGKNSVIVESLLNGKRMPVFATQRASTLNEISMYTLDGDIKLSEVMANIYKLYNGQPCIDAKKATPQELKAEMDKVLPQWDKDRIYVSDLKKLFTWYNQLQANGLVSETMEKPQEETEKQ